MLLHDIITTGSARDPHAVALIFRDQAMTYGELAISVERLSAGFFALGIRAGDRIALLLPNCPPFVVSYFAASRLGAIVVPVNPLLKPAELEYIWRDAGVRLVVTIAPLLPGTQAARQNLPQLTQILCINTREELPDPTLGRLPGLHFLSDLMQSSEVRADARPQEQSSEDARAQGSDLQQEASDTSTQPTASDVSAGPDDCAVIIYTSGTTGHPKGAMLSHKNLVRNVEQIQARLQFLPNDRFLTVIPLFHAFAATVCMNTCLQVGCAAILLENFAPVRTLETIAKHQATIFPAVPAIFNSILTLSPDPTVDTTSLRVFVSGGAPLPASTLAALEQRYGVPVLEGDGPTECSPVTSVNPLDGPRKIGSVGPALPDVEVAIFDEQNHPLPIDTIGEIVVRGDNVMLGYLNQPEATLEAMSGGWYHTGDLGKIDADGYIFIVDRKKDMIISAGLNVYPREVEEVLLAHPGVADVAVIGQHDALRGEEVVAVVVRRISAGQETAGNDSGGTVRGRGEPVQERELLRWCRDRMANYKVPRSIVFRETLPRGGTGKVVKRLLKKEMEMESAGSLPE